MRSRPLFGAGANVIYADLHEDGLMLQQLADQIRMTSQKPVLAYTIPTFQNPTGQTLSYEQRWELCRILLRAGIPTVEDDTFGFLRFEGERIPTLFEMSGQATIYSTSFSVHDRAGASRRRLGPARTTSPRSSRPAPTTPTSPPRSSARRRSSSSCDARRSNRT